MQKMESQLILDPSPPRSEQKAKHANIHHTVPDEMNGLDGSFHSLNMIATEPADPNEPAFFDML